MADKAMRGSAASAGAGKALGWKALGVALLEASGFKSATIPKSRVQVIDATGADGSLMRFWYKKGWSYNLNSSAIQFGGPGEGSSKGYSDEEFLACVHAQVEAAKAAGAEFVLMVQPDPGGDSIWNWLAMPIDSLYAAYEEQQAGWSKRTRNGSIPTLYFVDERNLPEAQCIEVVRRKAVDLGRLAIDKVISLAPEGEFTGDDGATVARREVYVRLRQNLFRERVGDAYGWRCAVSKCALPSVLEAAHLPGRSWREHNRAQDGVLLRVDLHRLLDKGLARIENGIFLLDADIHSSEYKEFHGVRIQGIESAN